MRTDPVFGDLSALRAKMLRWAKRYGADGEDLVQAALLKMLAHRDRAPGRIEEIEPWAFVVLRNAAFDASNKRRDTVSLDAVLELAAVENPERQTWCRQVLSRAPGFLIAVGMGGGEAALTGAARSRTHRARAELARVAA